jgi:pimeloyl-ACP methyl ester carboxylesterase
LVVVELAPARLDAGITEVTGVTGRGAKYSFHVPNGLDGDVWNGKVVYYAHGYLLPKFFAEPVIQPETFLNGLLALGFAVAQSSYSRTGSAIKEAIVEMHQLRGLFRARFGEPTRSFLLGRSMGGPIVLGMAERYPGQYDGVLPICGAVGGTHLLIDQLWGVRAAFDFYYPGALPGHTFDVPDALGFGEAFAAVQGAVFGSPAGALLMAGEQALDINAANFNELVVNLAIRIGVQADGTSDLVTRSHGHIPFDNLDVVYDNPALNAGIDRFVSTPDAERYYEHYLEPSGHLSIPIVTLHNIRDPLVGIEHEVRFAQVVAAAGSSALLVQQTVGRFGHCSFKDQEVIGALLDLVDWVENGVVPAPGDVTMP